jgi:hypothetical protein
VTRPAAWICLLLLACEGDECPDVSCTDSLTVVFEGGGLLDSWTVVLTDETGRQESFKCYGQEVRNLTDESLLVWCEPDGFTVAGWTMTTLNLSLTDKDGTYEWEQNPVWEEDYGFGEDCPATCSSADMTVILDAATWDTG